HAAEGAGEQILRLAGDVLGAFQIIAIGSTSAIGPVLLRFVYLLVVVALHLQSLAQRRLKRSGFLIVEPLTDLALIELGLKASTLLLVLLADAQHLLHALTGLVAHPHS